MTDAMLRLGSTIGLFGLFVVLEHVAPARPNKLGIMRFCTQTAMTAISSILSRLALAGGLASLALMSDANNFGIFNRVSTPDWIAIGVSFLAIDFAVWCQHVALHKLPWFWRLHRVHHGDTTMDVTTALRFHPFEILASLAFKAAIILLLGAPPLAVLAFEIALGAGALFTHANIALPNWLERGLRIAFVTPALHLIHHSPDPLETNSNYGFSFSIWDRIFGTFRPERRIADGPIGLEDWRAPADQTLAAMLANPFKK